VVRWCGGIITIEGSVKGSTRLTEGSTAPKGEGEGVRGEIDKGRSRKNHSPGILLLAKHLLIYWAQEEERGEAKSETKGKSIFQRPPPRPFVQCHWVKKKKKILTGKQKGFAERASVIGFCPWGGVSGRARSKYLGGASGKLERIVGLKKLGGEAWICAQHHPLDADREKKGP